MIKVIFKSLEKSQFATDIVTEKLDSLIAKFPDLKRHKIEVYLSMENSLSKTGRDVFSVKVVLIGKKYGGIVVEKKNVNLYLALDDLLAVMLENLNRKGDRVRVRERSILRKQKNSYAV
jgi:ribosome-associated translation inhibitor RaiA